jgi:hypothetical protein
MGPFRCPIAQPDVQLNRPMNVITQAAETLRQGAQRVAPSGLDRQSDRNRDSFRYSKTPRPARLHRKPKCLPQAAQTDGRDGHSSRVSPPFDPTQLETSHRERCADAAAEMRTTLGPIEARSTERAPVLTRASKVDPEALKKGDPGFGDLATLLAQYDMAVGAKAIRQPDAEPAGKMIVTGTGSPHGLILL